MKYFPKYERSKSQKSIEKLSSILQFLQAYITSLKEIINQIYEKLCTENRGRDGWVLFRHMSKTPFMISKACNRWKKEIKIQSIPSFFLIPKLRSGWGRRDHILYLVFSVGGVSSVKTVWQLSARCLSWGHPFDFKHPKMNFTFLRKGACKDCDLLLPHLFDNVFMPNKAKVKWINNFLKENRLI